MSRILLPQLASAEATAIADRVAEAVLGLGVRVTEINLESVKAGLFIQARVGDRLGACLVPHGFTATWLDVAKSLVAQASAETVGSNPDAEEFMDG